MIITLKVKPGSKSDSIEYGEEIVVKIKERPIDGKANTYLIKYLSKVFNVPKSSIQIVGGESSQIKRVSIPLCEAELKKYLKRA